MSGIKVLFVTPEVYPLIKVGGLGDISGALPAALRQIGVDVRLLVPGYPAVLELLQLDATPVTFDLFPGVGRARMLSGVLPDGNTPVLVVDCPTLYARPGGPYADEAGKDWPDNHLRFGALAKAAALLARPNSTFVPDLIHCNDWPTGLVPAYLHYYHERRRPRTLMSIHNMAYQGLFARETLPQLGLPQESFGINGLEFNGLVSFLKAGLYYADWLSTVSATYAQEIQTGLFGHGLEGLVQQRHKHLSGILNGIDGEAWNPASDRHLFSTYTPDNLSGKAQNKRELRKKLGLNHDANLPLLGVVSRLTHQKGFDLLLPIIPQLLHEGAQLAVLGIGEDSIEQPLQQLAAQYPEHISFTLGYDEALAHQIEAGADLFLMPSRYEPCGLNQMYSMRYGTLPVVRRTGGLADSVVDTTPAALDHGMATGFVFDEAKSAELLRCLQRALLVFRDKKTWRQLQRHGMERDFSWRRSAQEYLALYEHILRR